MGDGGTDGGCDSAGRFVNVAEAVRFVDDDEVPGDALQYFGLGGGEVIGTDDDGIFGFEGAGVAGADG